MTLVLLGIFLVAGPVGSQHLFHQETSLVWYLYLLGVSISALAVFVSIPWFLGANEYTKLGALWLIPFPLGPYLGNYYAKFCELRYRVECKKRAEMYLRKSWSATRSDSLHPIKAIKYLRLALDANPELQPKDIRGETKCALEALVRALEDIQKDLANLECSARADILRGDIGLENAEEYVKTLKYVLDIESMP